MITIDNILETNRMITENKLDVRTITMGISLRDCAHPNIENFCRNVYDKITKSAEFLVKTGEDIEAQYGIPIIHKRISVTPIAIAAEACKTDSYVPVAEALDKAAKEVGVNFIGGFSALVEKVAKRPSFLAFLKVTTDIPASPLENTKDTAITGIRLSGTALHIPRVATR